MRKIQAIDGQVIKFPKGNGIIIQVCCDCLLTHQIKVELQDEYVALTFNLDRRSTTLRRNLLSRKDLLKLSPELRRPILRKQANRAMKKGLYQKTNFEDHTLEDAEYDFVRDSKL